MHIIDDTAFGQHNDEILAYEAQLSRRLGSTPQWLIDAKNITTGIESVKTFENTDNSDNKTYDLNGMPVGKNYKGVVVKKGKKMINGVI